MRDGREFNLPPVWLKSLSSNLVRWVNYHLALGHNHKVICCYLHKLLARQNILMTHQLPPDGLYGALVLSQKAHARILSIDDSESQSSPGFVEFFFPKMSLVII
ncbi:unnamed protein product [Thlaspi arvense]|uniref:Aldehyde oxidase/xanthine dehydrogenase a/b hammerhead domain-containing protein n=1 Tax=Thlaspi arvense TaxID=13288 RepID=A0AAU9TB24_THLAR|nr:unnamed protein product [Thlaspi arvense]